MIGVSTRFLVSDREQLQKNEFKLHNIVDHQAIVEKEKKRLGVKHPKINLQDLGLSLSTRNDDLFKLVLKENIKILSFTSIGYRKSSFKLSAQKKIDFTIQKGTLLYPFQESRAANTQTLVVADDLSTQASEGQSQFTIQTFCYNSQLRAPGREKYLFGSIRSIIYEKGMNQFQVWNLTQTQMQIVQKLQKKYNEEDLEKQVKNNDRPCSAQN